MKLYFKSSCIAIYTIFHCMFLAMIVLESYHRNILIRNNIIISRNDENASLIWHTFDQTVKG